MYDKQDKRVLQTICLLVSVLASTTIAAKDVKSVDYETEAETPWLPGKAKTEKEFNFRDGLKARLYSSGDFNVEAVIQHRRLRCGDYSVGVQFAVGKTSCADAEWLSELRFLTKLKHCNSATRLHLGGLRDESLATQFERVTCARVQIKCRGVCDWNLPDRLN